MRTGVSASRWSAVAAFALVGAASQMAWLTFAPVTTVAADRYGVSESAVGWLANVYVLAFVLLAIPAGVLLDRRLRSALLLGAGAIALGCVLRALGDSYPWLLIGSILAALGQPVVLTGIAGLTHNYLAPAERARGIAAATASTWAGFIAAFALGTVMSTTDLLPALLWAHAAFATAAAAVLAAALRRPAPFQDEALPSGVAESVRAVRGAWDNDLVRHLCLFAFFPFGTFTALTTWTQSLLDPAGVSVEEVGLILVACLVAGVAGTALIPPWAASRGLELRVSVAGLGVAAGGCVLLALSPGFWTGLIAMTLAGMFLLPMLAVALELVERGSGDGEGVASGLVWTLGNLGAFTLSTVIAFTVGRPGLSYLILGAATLLALPLLGRLRGSVERLRAREAAPVSAT